MGDKTMNMYRIDYVFADKYVYTYYQNVEQWTDTGTWYNPFILNTLAYNLYILLISSKSGQEKIQEHGDVVSITVAISEPPAAI